MKESKVEDLLEQIKGSTEKLDLAIRGQEFARTDLAKIQMQIEHADKSVEKADECSKELRIEVNKTIKLLSTAEASIHTLQAVRDEQINTIKRLDARHKEDSALLVTVQNKYEKLQSEYQSINRSDAAAKEQLKTIERIERDYQTLATKYDELTSKHDNAIRSEATALAQLKMHQGD